MSVLNFCGILTYILKGEVKVKGKQFVNLLSYFAIAFIAIALVINKILGALSVGAAVANALTLIAEIIAYAITAVFAFYFAKSKRNIAWMIVYIIAIILIIIFLVLNHI